MATHSSVLAWRIAGTAEPGGQPSMGSHRIGHDWSHSAAAAAASIYLVNIKGFPSDSVVKNLSAMQEIQIQFLGWENLLEKEMVNYSSVLPWEIP